jgi:hypothetical protein
VNNIPGRVLRGRRLPYLFASFRSRRSLLLKNLALRQQLALLKRRRATSIRNEARPMMMPDCLENDLLFAANRGLPRIAV